MTSRRLAGLVCAAGLRRSAHWGVAAGCLVVAVLAGPAAAQEQGAAQGAAPGAKPVRGAQAIEIRGQVPTPQVVTVRPRETPVFSREVLTPSYFDAHFWQALLTPYELAPNLSSGSGATPTSIVPAPLPGDSTFRLPPAADSAHPAPPAPAPPAGSPAPTATRGTPPNAPREK
jgi:hypothetical protein